MSVGDAAVFVDFIRFSIVAGICTLEELSNEFCQFIGLQMCFPVIGGHLHSSKKT